MSNSPLISEKVPAHRGNYTVGRPGGITEITLHHMSGKLTARRCGELFQAVGRGGSSHYGIGWDGGIALYVDEKDTAWTNSDWNSNCRAVTIEVSNSENAYPWPVSDKSLDSLVRLVADIAARNSLGKLVRGKNFTWHKMYAATDCPGDYLMSKIDEIIARANDINFPAPRSTPTFHPLDGMNIARRADRLVAYSGRRSTGTNKWGYEVPLDRNGVALSDPVYRGDNGIPVGGTVLSGHGKAGEWVFANVKCGSRVTLSSGGVKVDKRLHRSVDGINSQRLENYLCVYSTGLAAPTNGYGYEVVIKDGKATSDPEYGKGRAVIPKGGFVLSGHLANKTDSAGWWIYKNVRKGTSVTFDGKVITVG